MIYRSVGYLIGMFEMLSPAMLDYIYNSLPTVPDKAQHRGVLGYGLIMSLCY